MVDVHPLVNVPVGPMLYVMWLIENQYVVVHQASNPTLPQKGDVFVCHCHAPVMHSAKVVCVSVVNVRLCAGRMQSVPRVSVASTTNVWFHVSPLPSVQVTRSALVVSVYWDAEVIVIVPLILDVSTTGVSTHVPRTMCVALMPSVRFRINELSASVLKDSTQFPPQSRVAYVFQPLVCPMKNVAPTLYVNLESAIQCANRILSVLKGKVVLTDNAKRFALVTAIAFRVRFA